MIIDKHAPINSMQVSEKYFSNINKDLKELLSERDKMKKEVVKHNSSPFMKCYRKSRNKVNRINITRKRQDFSEQIFLLRATWKNFRGQSSSY